MSWFKKKTQRAAEPSRETEKSYHDILKQADATLKRQTTSNKDLTKSLSAKLSPKEEDDLLQELEGLTMADLDKELAELEKYIHGKGRKRRGGMRRSEQLRRMAKNLMDLVKASDKLPPTSESIEQRKKSIEEIKKLLAEAKTLESKGGKRRRFTRRRAARSS